MPALATNLRNDLGRAIVQARQAAEAGYILATDVADYLVTKGVPFREAHGIAAQIAAEAAGVGKELKELPLKTYRRFSPHFEDDILSLTVASHFSGGRMNPQIFST